MHDKDTCQHFVTQNVGNIEVVHKDVLLQCTYNHTKDVSLYLC